MSALQLKPALCSKRFIFLSFFILMLAVTACQKDAIQDSNAPASKTGSETTQRLSATNAGSTMTEITFTATAMISYCWGENILFSGIIENHVQTTVTENGNHYSRHFTTKGMTAIGVDAQGNPTGTMYNVIGGAEMFSIKDAVFNPTTGALNLAGSLTESDIVIHRGTLVFENVETGEKVIARHDIQNVPGQGIKQNRWLCNGN